MTPKPSVASHLAPQVGRSLSVYPTSNNSFQGLWVNLQGFPDAGQATVDVFNSSVPSFPIWEDPFYYLGDAGSVNQTYEYATFGSAGTYVFSANETGAPNATATFTDTPGNITISATPSTVAADASTLVIASGNGLATGQPVDIYIGSVSFGYEQIGTGVTSADLDQSVTIPSVPAGTYILFIQDDYRDYAATTITVTPAVPMLTLTPDAGNPGTPVTATGTGLTPSVSYGIYFDDGGTLACSGTTNPDGSYSCSFDVPAVSTGYNMVEAIDADELTAGANFDVQAIEVEELTESQKAGWFLSFSAGDPSVSHYDYTIDHQKYFEVSTWRLDTMSPPDAALGADRKSVYDEGGSYLSLQMKLTKNVNQMLTDYFQGEHISSFFLTGYINNVGEVQQIFQFEFVNDLIYYESVYATNGSAPFVSFNISFEKLIYNVVKGDVDQNSGSISGTSDEWTETDTTSLQPAGSYASSSDTDYLLTTNTVNGDVSHAKRTGTEIWTWDEASPNYLNLTTKFSGGAISWALTNPRFTWVNVLAYSPASGPFGYEHQLYSFEFTRVTTERVVFIAHDGYLPTILLYFEFNAFSVKYYT